MLRRVISFVISLHLIFIVVLLFTQNPVPPKRAHPIKVRDVQPRVVAVESRPAKVVAPVSTKRPPAKPTPSSAPQKATAKLVTAKKKAAAPSSTVKASPLPQPKTPPPPKIIEPEWAEIDQALAKIEQKVYSVETPVVPKQFVGEDVDALLTTFLHEALTLPEVGDVRVELTVGKEGAVEKVVILSSESEKNRHYLLAELPKLRLPLQGEQVKTWTLTFSNEI